MALNAGDGILLVAHGTVERLEDLPDFLGEIRRGRPVPPGLVDELEKRYRSIGGSPLARLTRSQASALQVELGCPVLTAMRLWHPRVEEVLKRPAATALRRLCVLPLAPFSVPVYNAAAKAAFAAARSEAETVPEPVFVDNWGLRQEFIEAHVSSIRDTLAGHQDACVVVLSAHSLPRVVIERGDPYADLVCEAATKITGELGIATRLAYQSPGADGGDWLGPDLPQVLERLRADGAKKVVVAPFGFLADHVETLYDIDIEARGRARALGLEFVRVPALNTHPKLISAMAQLARRALA